MVVKRMLLKLGGEEFGPNAEGKGAHDPVKLLYMVGEIKKAFEAVPGLELAIVPGGGNIGRGSMYCSGIPGFSQILADYTGMMNTIPNGLVLEGGLEREPMFKDRCRVMSAFPIPDVAEPYSFKVARSHLEKKRIVILVAGTGTPRMTTDGASLIRAIEVEADLMAKGTKVRGVHTADPFKDPSAKFLPRITCTDFRGRGFDALFDQKAIVDAKDSKMPIRIFKFSDPGSFASLVLGEDVGTLISAD